MNQFTDTAHTAHYLKLSKDAIRYMLRSKAIAGTKARNGKWNISRLSVIEFDFHRRHVLAENEHIQNMGR